MDFYSALRERMERQHGPLGERLRNALTSALDAGLVGPGESLPSEREMSERLDISRSTVRQGLKAAGLANVDYVTLADEAALQPLARAVAPCRLFAACWLGRTRLIDNWPVS